MRRKECQICQGHTLAAGLPCQSSNCARLFSSHLSETFHFRISLIGVNVVFTFYLQYVALETSLQTEEIELYLVKECQPDIISGDGKLDEDNNKFEFLAEEEVTMAQLKTNNLSFGHLVINLLFKS